MVFNINMHFALSACQCCRYALRLLEVPMCKEKKKKTLKKGRTAAKITVQTASINHWQINESAIQAEEIKEGED